MKSLFPVAALSIFGLGVAFGQTPDNRQNGLLKGSYRFRHVAVQNVDSNYDPTEITATFGTIVFDGAGNYTVTATTVDNTVSNGTPTPLNVIGTYAIGSSGAGYIANPIYPADPNAYVYGAVAQGVYTGSSTESQGNGNTFNDIFVAIPVASSAPTNASFTSPYQTGLLDITLSGGSLSNINNALFELSPNGKGGLGAITLNGQTLDQGPVAQTITGAAYNFNSDGSATLTIPPPAGVNAANALFTGSKTIFESADGNFILGWTAGGYDIFFGVKALTVTGTNALSMGLYFTAALEDNPGVSGGTGTDSYYGGTNNTGDPAGDSIVHQRLNVPGELSFDFGFNDNITLNADGTTPTDSYAYNYIFGDGGQAFVAIGTSGYFSLVVGMQAPAFAGTGVYLSPIGVANTASFAPVTASIAPGELIDLFGTGLSSTGIKNQGGQVFPTTLGGVTVTIDSILCPIWSVSPTLLQVAVPYEVASNQTGLANIQVNNNGTLSNMVQVYLTDAAPGSFSQSENGIGYAAANHALTGQEITPANPAQRGETISLYLTGLGTVTPTVTDGALGPSTPLSWSDLYNAGNLSVYFYDYANGTGNYGTVTFAGLAPTLAGLYQINVTLPRRGLALGDNILVEFVTDAARVTQIQIPYGPGASSPLDKTGGPLAASAPARASHAAAIRSRTGKPMTGRVVRGGPAAGSGNRGIE